MKKSQKKTIGVLLGGIGLGLGISLLLKGLGFSANIQQLKNMPKRIKTKISERTGTPVSVFSNITHDYIVGY